MIHRLHRFFYSHTGRLLLGGMFVHALLLPLLLLGLLHLETTGRESQFVAEARARAHLFAALLAQESGPGRVARFIDELVQSGQVAYADYLAAGGEFVAAAANPRTGVFHEDAGFGGHGDHIYYVAVPAPGGEGSALRVGYSEQAVEDGLNGVRRTILLLVGGYLLLSAIMLLLYGRLLRHSLQRLLSTARRPAGSSAARLSRAGGAELAGLAADLERMQEALKRREQEVAEREARQRAMLETAAEGIVTLDAEGRIESLNKAAEKLFGCRADEVAGTPFVRFLAPEAAGRFQTPEGRPAACSCLEIGGRRHGGEACELMLSVSETSIAGTRCYTLFVQDISERIAYETRLAHLATHDSLTGLPNRALFADRLSQALAHAGRGEHVVGLLFVDLDRFKAINDQLGHHTGDRVLQSAARRLKGCLRSEDTLARLGGDEFTLVLPQLERPTSAAIVAENIVQALERPFLVAERELSVSCSIGIAVYPFDGQDADELCRNADAAMYAAKRAGGHGFRFHSPPIDAEAADRLELDAGLRHALERGELLLHYQPQVDAQSLRVVGVEALPHWRHPQRGLLAPARFLPLAEGGGVMAALAEWTLAEACRQGRAWHDQGWPLTVAVRLAAGHFRHADLFRSIRDALAASGLPPAALVLELGAGTIAECGDEAAAVLRHLKELGVMLALDGFGTGYSSFSCLKRFPVDIIRIDRSFIQDIGGHAEGAILADAIIAMAGGLRIRSLADGVDSAEQLAYLQAGGCSALQGGYFGPPLPADEATGLLRRNLAPAEAAGEWRNVA